MRPYTKFFTDRLQAGKENNMWKVYTSKTIVDPKYGTRTVEIEQCEGSREFCEEYVTAHPGTYIAWYCV